MLGSPSAWALSYLAVKLFSKYNLCENHTLTSQTDGQTDKRTDRQTDRQTTYCSITALCIASRGNKFLLWLTMAEVTVHTVMDGDLVADASVLSTVRSSASLESRSSFIHTHHVWIIVSYWYLQCRRCVGYCTIRWQLLSNSETVLLSRYHYWTLQYLQRKSL